MHGCNEIWAGTLAGMRKRIQVLTVSKGSKGAMKWYEWAVVVTVVALALVILLLGPWPPPK
jgi:hypothetical protein